MAKKKTKSQKIKTQIKRDKELEKLKITEVEFQNSIEKQNYRKQQIGLKTKTTNAERQKEFAEKQAKDGLRKIQFWLPDEIILIIEKEQKEHLRHHKIRLNKSKILCKILRKNNPC